MRRWETMGEFYGSENLQVSPHDNLAICWLLTFMKINLGKHILGRIS